MAYYDIYREQLAGLHRGYALWEPDTGGLYQQIEIGDVGFVDRGHFQRLFNVHLPPDDPSHTLGVPQGFVPLASTPIDNLALPRGDYFSTGVESGALDVGAQIAATQGSGSGSGSARASFSCSGKQGAVLSLPFGGRKMDALNHHLFRNHIMRNCHSWFAFAQEVGIGVGCMEDLILVTGCDRGESWALAAFTTPQSDAEIVFEAASPIAGNHALRWTAHQQNSNGILYNYGPRTNHTPNSNQCFFIRGYRAKTQVPFPNTQVLAGQPAWAVNGRYEQQVGAVLEAVALEQGPEFRDPVVAVLDYVLQRFPYAELAIVHDDDLRNISIDGAPAQASEFRTRNHLSAGNVAKYLQNTYGVTPLDDRSSTTRPSSKVVQLIDVFINSVEAPDGLGHAMANKTNGDLGNGSASSSARPPKTQSSSRRNTKYACTICQKRKTKCESGSDINGVPCQSCQVLNIVCSFVGQAGGADVEGLESRSVVRREPRREKYAPQACNACRQRKAKCDNSRPACGPCLRRGVEDQCTWGYGGTAKSACAKVIVDSLLKKNLDLEERVKVLEAQLASPTRAELPPSPVWSSSSSGAETSVKKQAKKEETDDPDIEKLTAPMNHLHLEDNDLQLYGPTSIFGLAPRKSEPLRTSRDKDMGEPLTYVLYRRTDIDWARHLPSDVPLSQDEHDRILDLFFRCFSSWCLRVIPEAFLRDMHRALRSSERSPTPRTTHYSPMLHNAILALSTAFLDDPVVQNPETRKRFADKAIECLESEGGRPSMSAVLALSILSNYHSSRGSPTLGYVYFGISARIAQSLGLGVDCTKLVEDGVISKTDMRDRIWVFWATFCQDTCFSLYVGRDYGVHSVADYGRIPIPFGDIDPGRWPWSDQLGERPSHLGETFAATCKLMVIAREIVDVVSNFNRLSVRQDANDEDIRKMDLKLTEWKNALPIQVDVSENTNSTGLPHQLMLSMAYHWLVIVLHRPFYCRKPVKDHYGFEMDHVKICDKAAMEIMNLATAWRSLYPLRCSPITIIQVIPAAGTVFILAALQAASTGQTLVVDEACQKSKYTIDCLREIGESFESARGMADILQSLLDHQVMTRLQRCCERLPLGPLPAMEQEYALAQMAAQEMVHWPAQYDPYQSYTAGPTNGNHPYHAYPYPQAQAPYVQSQAPMQDWWNAQVGYQPYGFSSEASNIGFPNVNLHEGAGGNVGMGGGEVFAGNPLMMLATGKQAFPGYGQVQAQAPQEGEQGQNQMSMQQGFGSFG